MYIYVHGGDIYQHNKAMYDFSANINPLGMPLAVRAALKQAAEKADVYPDPFCRELTKALSMRHHVSAANILCGNGAADLLFKLALALHPSKTMLLAPTFADYEKAFTTVNSKFSYYKLEADKQFNVQKDILAQVNKAVKLIVICNPNNPTGQVTDKELLLKLIEKAQANGTFVLVDECFMEFVNAPHAYSLISATKKYKNLLILRAFTKSYAMAGVRLGYLVAGDTDIIDNCRRNSQDWSVSSLAQAAGIAALNEKAFLKESKSYVQCEREYLLKNLAQLGILTFAPKANYVLIKVEGRSDFAAQMLKKGFLVRVCKNYHCLGEEYFRIAVRTHEENLVFIKAVKELLNK